MTRKLIISSLIFLALMTGLAVAAAKSDAAVRDGDRCPIAKPTNAKWRMAPNGCRYVSAYGGSVRLPKAATEISVVVDGREWSQHGRNFGPSDAQDGYAPRIGYQGRDSNGNLWVTNGYFRVARVYYWYS